LHTNDAAGAVTRLLDLGIEPYLVASSLLAVMAQRLLRRVCPKCKTMSPLGDEDRRRLGLEARTDGQPVALGSGCERCFETGYYERLGIFELLEIDETVRKLIVARSDAARIRVAALQAGMSTLRGDALEKLRAGATTVEEVLRVTHGEGIQN